MRRRLLCVLLCAALCLSLTGCFPFGSVQKIHRSLADYDGDRRGIGSAETMLPSLDALGDPAKLSYAFRKSGVIWTSYAYALLAFYTEEDYPRQVALLETQYSFLENPILKEERWLLPEATFPYQGFSFRVVPDPDHSVCLGIACKSFLMIGTNDDAHSIAWLYFFDQDLDYIALPEDSSDGAMSAFIDEYFCWPK